MFIYFILFYKIFFSKIILNETNGQKKNYVINGRMIKKRPDWELIK